MQVEKVRKPVNKCKENNDLKFLSTGIVRSFRVYLLALNYVKSLPKANILKRENRFVSIWIKCTLPLLINPFHRCFPDFLTAGFSTEGVN